MNFRFYPVQKSNITTDGNWNQNRIGKRVSVGYTIKVLLIMVKLKAITECMVDQQVINLEITSI